MKKGFTLIELLSVIVVIAIISVIAVPTLIGVVNKAKLGALKSSAYGLIEAGTLYNAQYGNTNNARFDITNNVVTTTEENKIKYRGSVKQGTVIVSTKGKVSVCVTDGKNSAYKNYNDTEVTLVSKKTCAVPANTSVVYLDGEATIDSVDAKNILDKISELENKISTFESNFKTKLRLKTYTTSSSDARLEYVFLYRKSIISSAFHNGTGSPFDVPGIINVTYTGYKYHVYAECDVLVADNIDMKNAVEYKTGDLIDEWSYSVNRNAIYIREK